MQAGAELARHLAVHCPAPQLATIGPPLLSGLVKVLRHESLPNGLRPEQPEAVSMRAFSYGAVATLCARAPALLRSDLALVTTPHISPISRLHLPYRRRPTIWS